MCEPGGRLQALGVVLLEEEIVVAGRIGSQLGVIPRWAQRQRSAALPAPHHLCRQEVLLVRARRVRRKILAERRDALMQLAKDDVGAVFTQNLGPWHRGQFIPLIRVAEQELAGLDYSLGHRPQHELRSVSATRVKTAVTAGTVLLLGIAFLAPRDPGRLRFKPHWYGPAFATFIPPRCLRQLGRHRQWKGSIRSAASYLVLSGWRLMRAVVDDRRPTT